MRRLPVPPLTFVMLLTLVAAGCGDSRGVGSLKVAWLLGGPGCEEAGITTIRVRLLEDGSDVLDPPTTAECGQGFAGLAIDAIPSGKYTLLVEGRTAEGRTEFEGRIEDVRIRENEITQPPPVVLLLKTASLRLRWGFRNGLLCGSNGVLSIQATLIDDLGNEVLAPTLFPCELPLASGDIEGGVLVTNLPARRTLAILMYALNIKGVAVQFGYGEADTAPGETASVSVLLDKCGVDAPCL